jgi:hypothetical protein
VKHLARQYLDYHQLVDAGRPGDEREIDLRHSPLTERSDQLLFADGITILAVPRQGAPLQSHRLQIYLTKVRHVHA